MNPYASPEPDSTSAETPPAGRPPRLIFSAHAALAVLCVLVGISETTPSLRWARPLISIAPLAALILLGLPQIMYKQCVARRVGALPMYLALAASLALTLIGVCAMVPLVQ